MTSSSYRYVLEEGAFEFFVQLADEEREFVHSYFRWLAAHPQSTGRGFHNDATGRPNYASLCGPFLIVHWADHAAKELRIVRLLRD